MNKETKQTIQITIQVVILALLIFGLINNIAVDNLQTKQIKNINESIILLGEAYETILDYVSTLHISDLVIKIHSLERQIEDLKNEISELKERLGD